MRPTPNQTIRRAGFTLVELLVVITIIAILFALTAAAVVKAMVKMDESKTRNDIQQLTTDVQAFKTDFQATYLPSRLYLPPAFDPTGESSQYISGLWPRISSVMLGTTPQAFQLWFPNNPTMTTPVVLSGDQCLVFFLGGYRDTSNNCFGFSTNPANPMAPPATSGESRKGPYFPFPPARLQAVSHTASPTPALTDAAFPSFIDTYGTLPYLYFSSRKAPNDYPSVSNNGQVTIYPIQVTVPVTPYSFTIYPFQISGPAPNTASAAIRVWARQDGFQIISGGKDMLYHDPGNYAGGTLWPGYTGGATDQSGYDNMGNFHPNLLGIGAN